MQLPDDKCIEPEKVLRGFYACYCCSVSAIHKCEYLPRDLAGAMHLQGYSNRMPVCHCGVWVRSRNDLIISSKLVITYSVSRAVGYPAVQRQRCAWKRNHLCGGCVFHNNLGETASLAAFRLPFCNRSSPPLHTTVCLT